MYAVILNGSLVTTMAQSLPTEDRLCVCVHVYICVYVYAHTHIYTLEQLMRKSSTQITPISHELTITLIIVLL